MCPFDNSLAVDLRKNYSTGVNDSALLHLLLKNVSLGVTDLHVEYHSGPCIDDYCCGEATSAWTVKYNTLACQVLQRGNVPRRQFWEQAKRGAR